MGVIGKIFLGGLIFFGGIIGLMIIGALFGEGERIASIQERLAQVSAATPEAIDRCGEIGKIFKLGSDYTNVQRENAENQLKGKIIEWILPVYEVSKYSSYYRIQTSGDEAIFGGKACLGTFLKVEQPDMQTASYVEQLKTGDKIKIKGRIAGTSMRNIEIEDIVFLK